jgi:hypothetical protein
MNIQVERQRTKYNEKDMDGKKESLAFDISFPSSDFPIHIGKMGRGQPAQRHNHLSSFSRKSQEFRFEMYTINIKQRLSSQSSSISATTRLGAGGNAAADCANRHPAMLWGSAMSQCACAAFNGMAVRPTTSTSIWLVSDSLAKYIFRCRHVVYYSENPKGHRHRLAIPYLISY